MSSATTTSTWKRARIPYGRGGRRKNVRELPNKERQGQGRHLTLGILRYMTQRATSYCYSTRTISIEIFFRQTACSLLYYCHFFVPRSSTSAEIFDIWDVSVLHICRLYDTCLWVIAKKWKKVRIVLVLHKINFMSIVKKL